MGKFRFRGDYVTFDKPRRIKFKTLHDLLANTHYIFSKGSMFTNPYIDGQSDLTISNTLDFNSPKYISQIKEYREFCLLMSEVMSPSELIDLEGQEFYDCEFTWENCERWVEVNLIHNGDEYTLYLSSLDMFEDIEL